MRLLHDEPNPLNVLGARQMDYCPEHFGKIKVLFAGWLAGNSVDLCERWIYNNLSGRFCSVENLELVDNKLETVHCFGFEEESESTMFSLGCPVLYGQDVKLL